MNYITAISKINNRLFFINLNHLNIQLWVHLQFFHYLKENWEDRQKPDQIYAKTVAIIPLNLHSED